MSILSIAMEYGAEHLVRVSVIYLVYVVKGSSNGTIIVKGI